MWHMNILNRKGSFMVIFDGISFIIPFKVISSRVAVICRAFSIPMAICFFLWFFFVVAWNLRCFQAQRSNVGGLHVKTNECQSSGRKKEWKRKEVFIEVRRRVLLGSFLFWFKWFLLFSISQRTFYHVTWSFEDSKPFN